MLYDLEGLASVWSCVTDFGGIHAPYAYTGSRPKWEKYEHRAHGPHGIWHSILIATTLSETYDL